MIDEERPRFIGVTRRDAGYLLGMRLHVVSSKSRSLDDLYCILIEGTEQILYDSAGVYMD